MIRETGWKLYGGLDLRPGNLDRYRRPGVLANGANYEAVAEGYRRIEGYERFDGRKSPSAANVLADEDPETLRKAIGPVPGAGEVLGVWFYRDACYAFRESSGGRCGVWKSSDSGWTDAGAGNLLAAGGEGVWQFCNQNFQGQSGSERMFGVNPGGQVFTYDGRSWSLIDTGARGLAERNPPVFVAAHRNHLFVAFREGSVLHSALGDPMSFSAVEGAAEIAIGDPCTGMLPGYRGGMFLFGRNSTSLLQGSSAANWALARISSEGGAIIHTAALMDEPLAYDDRGIRSVEATDAYGDFSVATVSEPVRQILDSKREGGVKPLLAYRSRRKSQYRLCFSDGTILVMTLLPGGRFLRPAYSITELDMTGPEGAEPANARTACSVEDSAGRERIFVALEGSPYVYEMDKGNSFDGSPIRAWLRLPYNDLGSSNTIKRFQQILLETSSREISHLLVRADFHDAELDGGEGQRFSVRSGDSVWGEGNWAEFDWSSRPTRAAKARIAGRGRNISVVIASEQTTEPTHTITGVTLLYQVRRRIR